MRGGVRQNLKLCFHLIDYTYSTFFKNIFPRLRKNLQYRVFTN